MNTPNIIVKFDGDDENSHISMEKFLAFVSEDNEVIKNLYSNFIGCDVHEHHEFAFRYACQKNNHELVDYFMNSPELRENVNVQDGLSQMIVLLEINSIEFLLKNYYVEITPAIDKLMDQYKIKNYPSVKQILELKELNKNLDKDLNFNKEIKRKKL